ncbi:MAG: hypothetical protein B6I38_02750 [Anaerolineaceae bacterium 4572_5.1]|nr:MAG: hypothetical protein B6I38_02750 [Anaerolineaceae bacterium 4572_5.1]RLD11737.1 MAG: hypothetical protein DRI56_00450 [Chloroflexota bacterium]
MINQLRLFIRLMKDERVSPLLKLLPFLSLGYLLLFPDLLPGPLDDAGIIALLMGIFLAFVPQDIIEEYKKIQKSEDDVVEGNFRDL